MAQRAIDIVAAALTTVLLTFGLFGSGLVVCMMPQTTQLLGNNFSGWNEATYPQDTMSELAEAVRSFSIDDTGRPQLEACVRTALEEHFPDIDRMLATGNTGQNASISPTSIACSQQATLARMRLGTSMLAASVRVTCSRSTPYLQVRWIIWKIASPYSLPRAS